MSPFLNSLCGRVRLLWAGGLCSGSLREVVVPGSSASRQLAGAKGDTLAILFFNLRDLSLCVFTDDETVHYALASCRACSLSLRQELLAFLSEVVSWNLWFQVLRVPTALNVVADALSREETLNTEWTLPHSAFNDVLPWASLLEVDQMVSPVNHHLPRWVSSFPHPDALAVDCQSIDWNDHLLKTPY